MQSHNHAGFLFCTLLSMEKMKPKMRFVENMSLHAGKLLLQFLVLLVQGLSPRNNRTLEQIVNISELDGVPTMSNIHKFLTLCIARPT